MRKSSVLILSLVLAVVAASAYKLLWRGDSERINTIVAASLEGEAASSLSSPRESAEVPAISESEPEVVLQTAYALVAAARNKYEAYSALLTRAEAGEIEFMYALQSVVFRCKLNSGGELAIATLATPDVRKSLEWQRIYAAEKRYCGERTALDGRAESLAEDFPHILRELAQEGDPLAEAYTTMGSPIRPPEKDPEESAQQAIAGLVDAIEPRAIEHFANGLLFSDAAAIRAIDTSLFSRLHSPEQRMRIKNAAATLYACSRGLDCGGNTDYQRLDCLTKGLCDVGLPVAEFMRRYRVTDDQYLLAQRYLQELQRLLRERGGG